MNCTLADIIGITATLTIWVVIGLSEGFLIGYASDALRFRSLTLLHRIQLAAMLSASVMPITNYFLVRIFGLQVTAAINLASPLMAVALLYLNRRKLRLARAISPNQQVGIFAACAAILIAINFLYLSDIQIGNALYLPSTAYDYLKHIAVADGICRSGVPPLNPMFYPGQTQPLFYYYFWHLSSAVVATMSGSQHDARLAVLSGTIWTSLTFLCTLAFAGRYFRFIKGAAGKVSLFAMVLLGVGNLYCLPAICIEAARAMNKLAPLLSICNWTASQIAPVVIAMQWVPQHINSTTAFFVASMMMLELGQRGDRRRVACAIVAAFSVASCIGLSLYLAVGLALTLGMWIVINLVKRNFHQSTMAFASGLFGLLLTVPLLLELRTAGSHRTVPLKLFIRPFILSESGDLVSVSAVPLQLLGAIACYVVGFGFILFATIGYWRHRQRTPLSYRESYLLTAAASCTLLATFVSSTIHSNDFGWRITIPIAFALTIWSAHYISMIRLPEFPRARYGWLLPVSFALGVCTVVCDIYIERLPISSFFGARTLAIREAYESLNRQLKFHAVLQHNPVKSFLDVEPYFGIYSHRQVVASDDHQGILFGPTKEEYSAVADQVKELFQPSVPLAKIMDTCSKYHIDALLVKDTDPVWNYPDSNLWKLPLFSQNKYSRSLIVNAQSLKAP